MSFQVNRYFIAVESGPDDGIVYTNDQHEALALHRQWKAKLGIAKSGARWVYEDHFDRGVRRRKIVGLEWYWDESQ